MIYLVFSNKVSICKMPREEESYAAFHSPTITDVFQEVIDVCATSWLNYRKVSLAKIAAFFLHEI